MTNKVIQFGEGGFLRGFVDWMIQIVNEKTDSGIGVTVVQPIKEGMCDVLAAQGYKYTHICRGAEGVDTKKVEVITGCVKPYDDFDKYIALADSPEYRFIVSNTTEAGICFDENDKIEDRPAKSFPGKLTQLLVERFKKNLDGFVFLPCELIDKNGDNLRECILKYADLWELGDDFKRWIKEENIFCNTLVDRINTGYPKEEAEELAPDDKMLNTSEYFHLWVIEGYNGLFNEIPFDKCDLNIILTDKLENYRTRKVRILNGAHTSMVAYSLLEGIETVREAVSDEKMRAFLNQCIFEEIIPTLDLPKEELIDYANSVLSRFENPYIKHYLSSIALNSVSKFKVRVLPSILEYKKRFSKLPENLIYAFAKLIEFYRTDMANDGADVMEFMKTASLSEILKNEDLWGENISFLEGEVGKYVN